MPFTLTRLPTTWASANEVVVKAKKAARKAVRDIPLSPLMSCSTATPQPDEPFPRCIPHQTHRRLISVGERHAMCGPRLVANEYRAVLPHEPHAGGIEPLYHHTR